MVAVASAVLIVLIIAVAWFLPPKQAWFAVSILLLVFFFLLGVLITKRPLGILVTEENVMSLSRFQTALWTLIVISAFLVIAIARIKNGVLADEDGMELADPLNITIGSQLLSLLGITAAALVGSPLIAATKKDKQADPKAVQTTAAAMVRTGNVPDSMSAAAPGAVVAAAAPGAVVAAAAPGAVVAAAGPNHDEMAAAISENATGILYKNPTVNDASFSDMFEGNEIGNAAYVDLGKVQMFFFTVVVAIAYIAALWDVISGDGIYDANFTFPVLSDGMIALLGISNAGYLASKGVKHTDGPRI
jgi:hypothetical protein